jgi:hypothetical protein
MDICKIVQIYYDEPSRNACFPNVELYHNKICTPFFENKIIIDLVTQGKHNDAKYFGVFSGHFKNKILHSRDKEKITPEFICSQLGDTDVVSFFRHHRNSNVVNKAEVFHPGFTRALKNIFNRIGFQVDLEERTRFTVYQNHFVAKSEVFEHYVKTLLEPAVREMENKENKELQNIIWQDSNYHKKRTMPEKLKQELGKPYYPYHTFLCERLFSIYLNKYKHITAKHL